MNRTDIHRPSLADPAEYQEIAPFYQGGSNEQHAEYADWAAEYEAAVIRHPMFQGNYANRGTCDHCGTRFAHGVCFLHVPTGELVHVGHQCAANTIGLPNAAVAARRRAEEAARRAAEEEAERQRLAPIIAAFRAEHEALVA